jgi:PAS domain S-box-containing protein
MDQSPALYSRLLALFKVLYAHDKTKNGSGPLSQREMYLLLFIRQRGSLALTEIAAELGIPLLDVSRTISKLQKGGLLSKKMRSSDHRSLEPELTSDGIKVLESIVTQFMDCLSGTAINQAPPNRSAVYFAEQYENSDKMICTFSPVIDSNTEIVDIEYKRANAAFIREFPAIRTVDRNFLLSRAVYAHFDLLISVCNTVWQTGTEVTTLIASKLTHREYRCTCSKNELDEILISSERQNAAVAEYLNEFIPSYRYFFESKPVKMVIDCTSGKILEVNNAAIQFYGWTQEEFLQKTIYEISMNSPELTHARLNASEQKREAIFHVVHQTASGTLKKVEVHASACIRGNTKVHYSCIIEEPAAKKSTGETKTDEYHAQFTTRYEKIISGMSGLLQTIEHNGKICRYETGDHFFEFGTNIPTFGFIIDGLFRVYYVSPAGREYTLEYLRPGYIIDSRTFTLCFSSDDIIIETVVAGKVLSIEQTRFMKKAAADPHAFELLYYLDKHRLTNLERRGLSLLTLDAKERYEQFVRNESDIAGYLRGQDIASYLGIAPETLSRIRSAENLR